MKLKQLSTALSLIVFCICLQCNQVEAQSVAGRILDGVEINEHAGKVEVMINFHFPIRYLSHFSNESGRELRIQLQPISVSREYLQALTKRELFNPDRGNPANISGIIYEGDSYSNLFLTIYFNSNINFTVKQGSDYRSLLVTVDPQIIRKNYVINLESSLIPTDIPSILKTGDVFENYSVYTTTVDMDGKTWHRLRLGFFPTKQAANKVLADLKNLYPQAWVTKVSQSDINTARQQQAEAESIVPSTREKPVKKKPEKMEPSPLKAKLRPLLARRKENLMKEGKQAMLKEDYHRAVQIYTRLLETGDEAIRQQALEYLGLARERADQLAHARAIYEKYLALYPEGDGAERVKQRLAGILSAQSTPKGRLRKSETADQSEWQTDLLGSFSQYYDWDESYTNNEDAVVNRSSLTTDLDLDFRARSDAYDIRTSFVGGYEKNFLDDDDNNERISSLYFDILSHKLHLSTRIGRQSRSSGGVLGRFDGAMVSWQALDQIGVNLVAGYPVSFSSNIDPDVDRPLYGISFDLGTFAEQWDFNTFYITQNVDGITDRESIGGEIRFFRSGLSFFTLVDYDISYNKLNTVLFNGNWSMNDKTTINLSADYRQSPILTTSNALQGQTVTSIDQMLQSYTEDEIRQLSLDRTATSRSFTLGATHSFNPKLQVSADFTTSELTGTPTSGGVEGVAGTGYDYFYSLQFIGNSLLKQGDIGIVGLRYSDTGSYNTYSLNLDTRYPITRNMRINPRFLVDYRTSHLNSTEQLKFRPMARLEYRWKRRYNLEIEGGLEFSTDKSSTTVDDRRGYFLTCGYRIDF